MKNQTSAISAILLLVLTSACSSERIYEMFRANRQQHCDTVPKSERDNCLAQTEDSFDDYERKRSE